MAINSLEEAKALVDRYGIFAEDTYSVLKTEIPRGVDKRSLFSGRTTIDRIVISWKEALAFPGFAKYMQDQTGQSARDFVVFTQAMIDACEQIGLEYDKLLSAGNTITRSELNGINSLLTDLISKARY